VIYQVQKCEQENPVLRSGRGSKKKIKKKEKRNPEAKVSADPGQFPFTGVLFCVIPIRRIGFGFGFGL